METVLETVALYLSFIMAVYLFTFSYIEGIRIANSDEKVHGATFIVTFTLAVVFSGFTYIF
jgi:hypothetical protein